mmetsp:Transcript_6309/g.39306  ORF Transcript_6309/g.39306 Transcript_6309/m.39306 type:complete len:402 (-) Transcript_6309:1873-3078(-)
MALGFARGVVGTKAWLDVHVRCIVPRTRDVAASTNGTGATQDASHLLTSRLVRIVRFHTPAPPRTSSTFVRVSFLFRAHHHVQASVLFRLRSSTWIATNTHVEVFRDASCITWTGSQRLQAVVRMASKRVWLADRRGTGQYDARYHSTTPAAVPRDVSVLPPRIVLLRHAESQGNVDHRTYAEVPDHRVPLTLRGRAQAGEAGRCIAQAMPRGSKLFFYYSPYRRSKETVQGIRGVLPKSVVRGAQEEVQLREQDFGNFQDEQGKRHEKAERIRFGRFFYRFPNGESGADVYDRITIFEDHLVRDINAGRFAGDTCLCLITHGLTLRIFLMRWFHWTVDEFLDVYNPNNATPVVMERVQSTDDAEPWVHTKSLYRISEESRLLVPGITPKMAQTRSPMGAE